jgi:hypothetical protein
MKVDNFTQYSFRFVQTEEMNKARKENRSRRRNRRKKDRNKIKVGEGGRRNGR